MIVFNNWTITVTGMIARQYDNLSRRIDIEGNLPAGYTWQLLVQCGGNADTILLEATETGAGAVLTADNLSKSGEYYIQLRGVLEADGVTRRHTNVVSAYIPESLTGLGTWPEVPTEFAQVEARILELYQHPPIPGSNGYWLVWDTDKDEYVESQLALPEAAAGGTSDHSKLKNRDAADQHPMSAIIGLEAALDEKQPVGSYLTDKALDTTLTVEGKAADAKAVGDQLSALSEEIVTTAESKVSAHNTGTDTHSDIRLLISGLTDRLNALADSDDTTLDQLSEVVAYIKSNRTLIEAITTNKVSVADIVDNLTTNVANKPLSAAQGVVLKTLIDAITVPDKLPNPNALTFTGAVTGSYDGSAPLEVAIPSVGGASGDYIPIPASAEVGQTIVVKTVDENGKPTEWEAVDLPSGGGQAIDKISIKITETVHSISLLDDITLYNRIRANIKVVGDSANAASGVLGATTPSGILVNYILNATKTATGYLFFDLRLSEQGAESYVTPNFSNRAYVAAALSHVYGLSRTRWTGALSLVPNATDWNFGAGTEIYLEAYRA